MDHHQNWWEEKNSAYLYKVMAESEKNILHKKLFLDLHDAAEKQATVWESRLGAEKQPKPTYKPNLRTRIVARLIQLIGAEHLHPMLSAMKIRGMSVFTRYHSEHKHTSSSAASNLRAAVFGVNDGLVSNVSLILGVAGAHSTHHTIILAGTAGLLAGAFSMGAGEYISVKSQREVFEYQIAIEAEELKEYPEEEMEELSLIYQAKGIPTEEADKLANLMISNPDTALDTLAREELGLNPDDMVSPVGAMISSFISFAFGAAVPLLPFLYGSYQWSLLASIGLTGIMLFLIGALLSLFTNKNPFVLGGRMLLIGLIAGCVTYFAGHWLGTIL